MSETTEKLRCLVRGVGPTEIARRTGLSLATAKIIVSGRRWNPRADTVELILREFSPRRGAARSGKAE